MNRVILGYTEQRSPSLLFEQLKAEILNVCPHPEVVIPYLKKIEKELEREKRFTVLELLDELEELLDITLFSREFMRRP